MTWLGGSEFTVGLVIVVLAALLTVALTRRGRRMGTQMPSNLFMAFVPVSMVVCYVVGVMLILHGTRLM